ncbi:hypothetical protein T440DRAFT_441532 [Plenodomus tracheiphilus IPT5]|uniref:Uncharacterized protein n=1 Tax=Plenodomus tracheiphilus IPT5 TaxID=1408161 RepID=A0A6A7BIC2_9PLEO|nr:hypothetical protein T440DRAFT_441532 [Plenodomus tracheiphilus IPT5]
MKSSDNKETVRIRACLASDPSISEVAEEAYRLCRVNSYLRKDRKQAQEELRRESASFRSKQAVLDDAIAELREEYPKTRILLDQAWGLLEKRNVRIPSDMKMAYHVLKEPNLHGWQARKGFKRSQTKKAETEILTEKQETKPMRFLLHTHEGKTLNLRDPTANDDSDIDSKTGGSDSELDNHVPSEPSRADPGNTLNVNQATTHPLAQSDVASAGSAHGDASDHINLSANNVVAGQKRQSQEEESHAQKKPRLDDEETGSGNAL